MLEHYIEEKGWNLTLQCVINIIKHRKFLDFMEMNSAQKIIFFPPLINRYSGTC